MIRTLKVCSIPSRDNNADFDGPQIRTAPRVPSRAGEADAVLVLIIAPAVGADMMDDRKESDRRTELYRMFGSAYSAVLAKKSLVTRGRSMAE